MSENNEPTKKKLTPKQRKAVAALIVGKTQAEAAAAAGVADRTVWRWLAHDALFAEAIKNHSTMALYNATRLLVHNLETAILCMVEVVECEQPPKGSSSRLRAAKMIVDSAIRLVETTDILERLERIEAKLSGGAA